MSKYTTIIGLEVHIELNTKSKMFCGCNNEWFGKTPNTHTCPVCLGLPGALPVANRKAIEGCIKIGMALNCTVPLLSKFDRKNYFYPDLAKGYQISQYDQPFAEHGHIVLSNGKRIGIRRAHMEEDTGKLMHATVNGEKVSLIDFNRSGSPLVEIVTDPDFESSAEVKEYLQKLQQIARYLRVANADMEKGGMRLEPNISLRNANQTELPSYKVEVKNINSFSFVEKAILYEVERQAKILDAGEIPQQETRGWDEDKKMTISQRSKEEAADYRYFPEPDIPPFVWTDKYLETLRKEIPELPDAKIKRFVNDFQISEISAAMLIRNMEDAINFEEAVKLGKKHNISPQQIANVLINKKKGELASHKFVEALPSQASNSSDDLPAYLIQYILNNNVITGVGNEELKKILQQIIDKNQKVVEDYKNGKTNAIMFLIGQAMHELKGRIKADTVRSELEKLLS